jgi:cytochrome oxidase Cu insertion factor (SCO1/SenC/PrrC family)
MLRWGRIIAAVLLTGSLLLLATDQASASQVGGQAPTFTLPATTGEKISLTDYTGKQNVVLFFYIAAFGPA